MSKVSGARARYTAELAEALDALSAIPNPTLHQINRGLDDSQRLLKLPGQKMKAKALIKYWTIMLALREIDQEDEHGNHRGASKISITTIE